ncbi:integrase core domain-containing protein [Deinococcus sp. HMF7604]|uniref:integrase core domain-containing protein n=1 Tax=Deinococcus betulae TaxID=2873312 RepID=UPI001CCC74A3|nr:integrase core domain-containing protein [Deinococcus betulae]MBZ9751162.1 integrase core domain-containing protein [Deinococcus betulae]
MLCCPKRRFRATTNSRHNEKRFPNLLREVIPVRPDQVWQADLTSVRIQQGFVYLACVLAARCPAPGLLRHSDQGVQDASRVYVDRLWSAGITPSMSRTDNPYDNAKMESFDKTLKTGEVDLQEYVDLNDARRHMNWCIADLDNRRRLHASLGYVPPAEFAARYTAAQT